MAIFDAILLVSLSGFIFYGLFFGLIRTVGLLLGVVVGAFVASRLYLTVADWIEPFFFGYPNLGKVAVFLILFSLVNRLVGLGFYLIDKGFDIISIIPFLKTVNRLGGSLLGFCAGSLSLGLLLYVASRYAPLEHWFGLALQQSDYAGFLLRVNQALVPLLPEVMQRLRSVV